jgi:hypothetical protein
MKRWLVIVLMLCAGCATKPYSPMATSSLEGDYVIYFEQADRVPRDVILVSWEKIPVPTGVTARLLVDPTDIAEIVGKVIAAAPQLIKTYSDERMVNALIHRRILIRGYRGTNELERIDEIIKSMSGVVENWMPQAR